MWKKLLMMTVWNIKYLRELEQFSRAQHKIIQMENRKAKNVNCAVMHGHFEEKPSPTAN